MDNEVTTIEKTSEYVKFKWRGVTCVERWCHICDGSGWTSIIKNKKGLPCRACRGRGTIPRRM